MVDSKAEDHEAKDMTNMMKSALKQILPQPAKDYWYTYHFKKRMYDPDGWERHVYDRILKSIRNHQAISPYIPMPYNFVDVGGFVGRYAYLIGREPGTRVWTYEPIPELYKMIHSKIRNMRNVNIYNYALGDTEEVKTIYSYKFSPNLPDNMSSGNTFNKEFGDSYKSNQVSPHQYQIQIHRLDNMLNTRIDGMKIDTEGWEVQVLQGAASLIDKHRPDLFLEYHGNKTELYKWLEQHHYEKLESLDETAQFSYGLHGHMVAWA